MTSEGSNRFYVGVALAISSSIFIGASFVIKKKGLIRLGYFGHTRAGSGGHGYLKDWVWWAGFLMMGVGEAANFIAYAFAPASVVTPLGAFTVLVGAILSSRFLGERLNLLGKVGCLLCVLGSTVIILHSPKEGSVSSMEELGVKLMKPGFIIYTVIAILASMILCIVYGPKYGSSNLIIYLAICSLIGSLNVMGAKGLGLALRLTLSGTSNELANGLTWLLLIAVIGSIIVQMNYLNKALDTFNTSLVTPVYYVFFTTLTIIASSILFEEWVHLQPNDIIGNLCGFLTIILAIFLLNAFKEWDISLSTLSSSLMLYNKPKDEQSSSTPLACYHPDDHSNLHPHQSHAP